MLSARSVVEFLGVPFALPPLKELRFKKPQQLTENYYGNEFKAYEYASPCMQTARKIHFRGLNDWYPKERDMSEDCLQLNMWVPENKTGAVIVFLFGGQYTTGSPSLLFYDGSILAEKTGTIVVNLNYRLGVFGFAYYKPNEKDGISGNLGLLDQQLGLKWVHNNIHLFGGDPKKVTLFGQGSGAAMATAHLFSSSSAHLFRRIIASSGTIVNRWATIKSRFAEENFEKLITRVKCNKVNLKDQILCMQNIDAIFLHSHASTIKNLKQYSFVETFIPVDKDNVFFKGNVNKQYQLRGLRKKNVDILIGKTAQEGSWFMPIILDDPMYGCKLDYGSCMILKRNNCYMNETQYNNSITLLANDYRLNRRGIKVIKKFCEKSQHCSLRDRVVSAFTDFYFNCDINRFAKYIKKEVNGNAYFYNFQIRSSSNPWPKWMGATHRYDLLYIFGHPFSHPEYYQSKELENERAYSEKIINIISGFVLRGEITREIDNLYATFKSKPNYENKFLIERVKSNLLDENNTCSSIKLIQKKYKIRNYQF
uniref:Acetylcholinesterase n=1 Tax=Strongyloides stercoralis TaxID=6248 RepID=A0AAF5DHL6_STRER